MLPPEDLKKLSREYAEDVFGESDYPFKEEDICNAEGDFESVVTFLSKDYCIVPKEVIKADYDHNALAAGQFAKGAGAKCAQIREWHQGKCDELISLFGKQLFEKEKQT